MNAEENAIENIIERFSKSKFRSSFYLKEKDKQYIKEKGIDTIRRHAYELLEKRLFPAEILNDGKQTPMRGHPVFIAQHATATCCRKCLYKWHKIVPNINLSQDQKDYVVRVIMTWISKQVS